MMPDNNHSLYDRLGGVYHIAAIVDDLVDRLGDGQDIEWPSSEVIQLCRPA